MNSSHTHWIGWLIFQIQFGNNTFIYRWKNHARCFSFMGWLFFWCLLVNVLSTIVCVWRDCMTTSWRRHGVRLSGWFVWVSLLEAAALVQSTIRLLTNAVSSKRHWNLFFSFSLPLIQVVSLTISTLKTYQSNKPWLCARRKRWNGLVPITSKIRKTTSDHAEWETLRTFSFFHSCDRNG